MDGILRTSTELACAIFVDKPNMEGGSRRPRHVDWHRLFNHVIEHHVGSAPVIHNSIYGITSEEPSENRTNKWFRELEDLFSDLGLLLRLRVGKDIDSWIMSDIWKAVIQTFERPHVGKRRLRCILLSGDGGYLYGLNTIIEKFGAELEIELIVYSWKASLHNRYLEQAAKIEYLDDVLQVTSS
jgi:hypothetical protein